MSGPEKCAGCKKEFIRRVLSLTGGHSVWVCRACGLAHTRPLSDEKSDPNLLTDALAYARAVAPLQRGFEFHYHQLLKLVRPYSTPTPRWLEIGCGVGDFLSRAVEAGYEAWGVEPGMKGDSFPTVPSARLLSGRVEDVNLPDNYFSVVSAVQVIEHLRSPRLFMDRVTKSLRSGGVLFIETPNFNALARRVRWPPFMNLNVGPGHWHLFSVESLRQLALAYGLKPLKTWTYFKALSQAGRDPLRRAALATLNGVFRPFHGGNTVALLARKP